MNAEEFLSPAAELAQLREDNALLRERLSAAIAATDAWRRRVLGVFVALEPIFTLRNEVTDEIERFAGPRAPVALARLSLAAIRGAVADHCGVAESDLVSPRQSQEISRPRDVFCFCARQLTSCTYGQIGRALGDRDHTTIVAAVRRVAARLAAGDGNNAASIAAVRRALGAAPPHREDERPGL